MFKGKRMISVIMAGMLLVLSAVSCENKDSSTSEGQTSDAEKPTGKEAFEALKEIVGDDLKEQMENAPTVPNTVPARERMDEEAEKAFRDCVESMYTSDILDTLKYMYPESMYDELIEAGIQDNFNMSGSEENSVAQVSVEKCTLLEDEKWHDMIESFFMTTAESNGVVLDEAVTVTKAYEAAMSFIARFGQTMEGVTVTAVVADIEGDGWKIIPLNCEQLEDAVKDAQ